MVAGFSVFGNFASTHPALRENRMTEIITMGGLELRFLQDGGSTGGALDLFEMVV